ncbi:Uncharacterised protein [Klebsiella pneumoniae]|nr:Uncharacterised protein [Klebsiella pneumoniae]
MVRQKCSGIRRSYLALVELFSLTTSRTMRNDKDFTLFRQNYLTRLFMNGFCSKSDFTILFTA